ncbi:MAG: SUMF1/EgtB/PvdO family nonheme iron enzyme [Chloroflexi bacterium]|nr:SUMF1/EgtB/PvdO family nonheme iron enzyme [Chloroflexota bacterium]
MANPNTADIRQYLTSAYSDEEITVLCADYFRDVSDNFATGMNKGQKIQLLLDHCQRRDAMPNLLAALQKDRPEQYRKRFGPVVVKVGLAPAPRERDPKQVFISHAHEDAEFAHRLAADLQAHGWRVWIAPDSIRPGEKWVEAINRGLEESGVFIVVLTLTAVKSRWVMMETNIAIELEMQDDICFIPLDVQPCKPPTLWNVYQRVPFNGRHEDGLQQLLRRLDPPGAHQATEQPVVPALTAQPASAMAESQPPLTQPAVLKAEAQPAKPASVLLLPDVLTIESPIRLELVRVPAGEFLMGSDPAKDSKAYDDEKPQHRVYVPEFYINKYPVINDQYAVFIKVTMRKAPQDWANGQIPANKGDHPVVNVTWEDAVAFCDWLCVATGRSIRLPTEAEWEKAARGADGRIYPWGNQAPNKTLCNFGNNEGDTMAVGQYSAGTSPCGALDMSGNVWEWTLSLYRPYPYQSYDGRDRVDAVRTRVVRGGSYLSSAVGVRCAVRNGDDPFPFLRNDGFRVVASPLHS